MNGITQYFYLCLTSAFVLSSKHVEYSNGSFIWNLIDIRISSYLLNIWMPVFGNSLFADCQFSIRLCVFSILMHSSYFYILNIDHLWALFVEIFSLQFFYTFTGPLHKLILSMLLGLGVCLFVLIQGFCVLFPQVHKVIFLLYSKDLNVLPFVLNQHEMDFCLWFEIKG